MTKVADDEAGLVKLQQQVDSSDDSCEVVAINDNRVLGRAA
jgi:hypothetical protein